MNKDNKSDELNDTDKKLHISDVRSSVINNIDLKLTDNDNKILEMLKYVENEYGKGYGQFQIPLIYFG
jgi:hypothetical protein